MTKVVCFVCLKEFDLEPSLICLACRWHICPHCWSCLCDLGDEAKRVAIAMYLSYVDLPDKKRDYWLNKAKKCIETQKEGE